MFLAVVVIREIYHVTVDDPSNEDCGEKEPGEDEKVNSVLVVGSKDPDNV